MLHFFLKPGKMYFLHILVIIIGLQSFVPANSQDHSAEILSYDTRVWMEGSTLISENNISIRINNPQGDVYSNVSIPYSSMVSVSNITGIVTNVEGDVVRKLKQKEIISVSAGSEMTFYDDQMLYYFNLKHKEFPYTITYTYKSAQDNYLNLVDWSPVMNLDVPTYSASLQVLIPSSIKVRCLEKNIKKAVISKNGNNSIYTWKSSYTKLLKEETLCPPMSELTPYVAVIPQKFTYDIPGSSENWVTFGDWIYKLTEGLQTLPEEKVEEIKASVAELSDTLQIIETLFHQLQDETRYVFIAIETGGLKPYSAEYVVKNSFGDCKALSNYFRSVLQVVGIESNYTLVNAASNISRINTDYPGQQFNHVILMVPLEKDSLWLDCTSEGAFAFAGSFIQNRKALIIKNGESYFKKIPMMSGKKVLNGRKMVFHSIKDTVFASVSCNYKGELYEVFLQMYQGAGHTSVKQIIRNYFIEPGFELVDYQIKSFHRDSAYIDFNYTARSIDYYAVIGDEVHIRPIGLRGPLFPPPEERKLPVQLNYPIFQSDTLIYHIPEGLTIDYMPTNTTVTNKYGTYSTNYSVAGDSIHIVKSLYINDGNYPYNEYPDFYEFIKNFIRSEVFQTIILKKTPIE